MSVFCFLLFAGMVLYSSTLCVRLGAAQQAAFEIVRQVWVLTIQLFECLNVATQSMCASYLGARDKHNALGVLKRALHLGTWIGLGAGLLVWCLRHRIVQVFTADPVVAAIVTSVIPVVAFMFPTDALASIMDGAFLASAQTNALSFIQVAGSLLQYAMLTALVAAGRVDLLSIWLVLKSMTFVRLLSGWYVHFMSSISAYSPEKAHAT